MNAVGAPRLNRRSDLGQDTSHPGGLLGARHVNAIFRRGSVPTPKIARSLHCFPSAVDPLQRDGLPAYPGVRPRLYGVSGDSAALLADFFCVDAKTAIAVCQQLRIHLTVGGEAHHKGRNTQRQRVIPIGMPGMPRFAIGVDYFRH